MSDTTAFNRLIYQIEDVMALLKKSRPTIDRWCEETRQGKNDFPLPFTQKGRRVMWTADAIHDWIRHRQSTALPPVNITTAKQRRKQEREYQERQQRAEAALEKHRNTKPK